MTALRDVEAALAAIQARRASELEAEGKLTPEVAERHRQRAMGEVQAVWRLTPERRRELGLPSPADYFATVDLSGVFGRVA